MKITHALLLDIQLPVVQSKTTTNVLSWLVFNKQQLYKNMKNNIHYIFDLCTDTFLCNYLTLSLVKFTHMQVPSSTTRFSLPRHSFCVSQCVVHTFSLYYDYTSIFC